MPNFLADAGQFGDIIDIEFAKGLVDSVGEAIVLQKVTIGVCSGCKASRYSHAGVCQLTDHFAERGILAAYFFDVGHAQLLEPDDVVLCHHFTSCMWIGR
ncbi:hypothetical protein D3C71_1749890 [compost metagenome]